MLNYNELRLDNWILDNGNPVQVYMLSKGLTFYTVNGVTLDKKTGRELLGYAMNSHRPHESIVSEEDRFSPIELTSEILEACGFVLNESINHWTKTWGKNGVLFVNFHPSYNKFAMQFGEGFYKILNSLHHLQNIFLDHTETQLSYYPSTISEKTE